MKSLLIIASFVALAVASPTHRDIAAGPTTLDEPIAVDPAIVEGEPNADAVQVVNVRVPPVTSLVQIILNINGDTSVVNAPITVTPSNDVIVAEAPVNVVEAAPESGQIIEAAPEPASASAIVEGEPIADSPVQAVAVKASRVTSLVQIILNVNGETKVVNGAITAPSVDAIVAEPVHVVEAAPEPAQVIEVAPEPVQIVEVAPAPIGTPVLPMPVVPEVIPEPIAIGTPQLPMPVVELPELN